MADVRTSHVPYKGAAQQLSDVMAKHVSMTFTSVSAALTDALKDPEFIKKLEIQGAEPALTSPQDFAKFIATESTKFAKIIAEANVTLEN